MTTRRSKRSTERHQRKRKENYRESRPDSLVVDFGIEDHEPTTAAEAKTNRWITLTPIAGGTVYQL